MCRSSITSSWRLPRACRSRNWGFSEASLVARSARGLLSRDPLVDPTLQHIERQWSVVDQRIVEAPNVEPVAERSPRLRPQRLDLELADFVAQRLARPDQVAVDFGHRVVVADQ